jgi:hypothetical protein
MFGYALAGLSAIVLVAASIIPDDALARRGGGGGGFRAGGFHGGGARAAQMPMRVQSAPGVMVEKAAPLTYRCPLGQ